MRKKQTGRYIPAPIVHHPTGINSIFHDRPIRDVDAMTHYARVCGSWPGLKPSETYEILKIQRQEKYPRIQP